MAGIAHVVPRVRAARRDALRTDTTHPNSCAHDFPDLCDRVAGSHRCGTYGLSVGCVPSVSRLRFSVSDWLTVKPYETW
jgi:hypothetical protein